MFYTVPKVLTVPVVLSLVCYAFWYTITRVHFYRSSLLRHTYLPYKFVSFSQFLLDFDYRTFYIILSKWFLLFHFFLHCLNHCFSYSFLGEISSLPMPLLIIHVSLSILYFIWKLICVKFFCSLSHVIFLTLHFLSIQFWFLSPSFLHWYLTLFALLLQDDYAFNLCLHLEVFSRTV